MLLLLVRVGTNVFFLIGRARTMPGGERGQILTPLIGLCRVQHAFGEHNQNAS